MVEQRNDFSKGSIPKAIMSLALPMTVAQLVNIMYSMVDRIYLGHLPEAGALALAGLGVTMPVIAILIAFSNLCGMGGSPLCSIERGKGNEDEAECVMGTSFTMLLVLGVVTMAVCFAFKRPMLYLFGASDMTFPYANEYLSIYLCGTIFVMISLGMNPFINSQGFGRIGMLTVILGAVVNIILDPLFIFVFDMGVKGAALATVIAQGCSAVWVLKFLTGKKAILRLKMTCMRPRWDRVKKIVALGLSGFFMSLTNCLVQVVCNKTLQVFGGDLYVGIMTIANSLREVFFMVVNGLTSGAQPVIGFNYGAGKFSRVRKSIQFSVGLTIGYAVLVWVLVMTLPSLLIGLFSGDAQTVASGIVPLRIYFGLFLFQSLQIAAQSVFVGLGKSRQAIFFSLLRKAIINAPLTVILPVLGMGAIGVFTAEAISQLFGGLACFTTMYLTVYRPLRNQTDR